MQDEHTSREYDSLVQRLVAPAADNDLTELTKALETANDAPENGGKDDANADEEEHGVPAKDAESGAKTDTAIEPETAEEPGTTEAPNAEEPRDTGETFAFAATQQEQEIEPPVAARPQQTSTHVATPVLTTGPDVSSCSIV